MIAIRFVVPAALGLAILLATPAVAVELSALVKQCEDCHDNNGVSLSEEVPTIAGISAPVHGDYLLAYQDKSRPCRSSKFRHGDKSRPETDMCAISAKLSPAEIKAVTEHFAARPFVAAKQSTDAAKAAEGKKLHTRDCAKCHTNAGREPADDASILGGQHLKYLQQALGDYKAGKREQPKKMAEKLNKWTDAELEAVAHYYASQQ